MYEKNIYKTARQKAGKTQEAAAEALGISVESIKAYENYSRIPPSNVVDGMCIIYDAIYLAYQHNRITSGEVKVVPEVEVRSLEQATISLIRRVLAFADKHRDRDLMAIAEDGIIDEDERPLFNEILTELEDIRRASIELQISRETRPE